MEKKVVTRFAPSPTGLFHAGSYRTAVFAYLYARKNGGEFILRIEDTDRERSKKEYEENILESLSWLSLDYDRFVRQSEQVGCHEEQLAKLVRDDYAYLSKEKHPETGVERELVRFRNPGETVTFHDAIRGNITFDTTELGDFVIAKGMREPLFHLAVVVDDGDAGVTHVIRGEDHISNTPRQLLIGRALGYPDATYAHLPLVLGGDKAKLSKRRGAKPLTEYRDIGILPEAFLNFIAMIGWTPDGDNEFFTKDELVSLFDLGKVHKHGAVFNEEKLLWMNAEYLKGKPEGEILALVGEAPAHPRMSEILAIARERAQTVGALREAFSGELAFFFAAPTPSSEGLLEKEKEAGRTLKHLEALKAHMGSWEAPEGPVAAQEASLQAHLMPYADQEGRGEVLWPLRYALTGLAKSPNPFVVAAILGKEEAMRRLETAIGILAR